METARFDFLLGTAARRTRGATRCWVSALRDSVSPRRPKLGKQKRESASAHARA